MAFFQLKDGHKKHSGRPKSSVRSVGMMRCVGAVCLLGLLAGARGAQVVVFGDSWATGARTAFTDMFDNHGANVT